MIHQLMTRDAFDLTLSWEALSKHLSSEQQASQPKAGSHPYDVRQWLLASSFLPTKWINRVFSVGGIRWQGERIHILAYAPLEGENLQAARSYSGEKLNILFEDDHCLVVYKPSGLPVHGASKGQADTLDAAVASYMLSKQDPILTRHIHRLDDETSGPVLYSKHELAQLMLDEAMRQKDIDREYVAIVEGKLKKEQGVIDAAIGKDRRQPKRRRITPNGETAVTHYRVLERYSSYTIVALKLETGRTHQIRVHMQSIGHPLVGDHLYGGSTRFLAHQALHGRQLTFKHPMTGDQLVVQAEYPDWYSQIKRQIAKR